MIENLTEVLRLTAEMENRAADGEWGSGSRIGCGTAGRNGEVKL